MSQKKTKNTPNQQQQHRAAVQPQNQPQRQPQAQAATQNVRLVENTKHMAESSAADVKRAISATEEQTRQALRPVASAQTERQMEKSFDALKDITQNQQIRWEALAESCKLAADVQQELQAGLQDEVNELLQEQVELSQKFLSCRQVNDFVELQNQALKCQINHTIDITAKLAEAWFRLATDAVEPIQNARYKLRNTWAR